jgi:hypothetical protein
MFTLNNILNTNNLHYAYFAISTLAGFFLYLAFAVRAWVRWLYLGIAATLFFAGCVLTAWSTSRPGPLMLDEGLKFYKPQVIIIVLGAAVLLYPLGKWWQRLIIILVGAGYAFALLGSLYLGALFSPDHLALAKGERIIRALEAYHTKFGKYPTELNDMVPEQISALPEQNTEYGWIYETQYEREFFTLGYICEITEDDYHRVCSYSSETHEWTYSVPRPFPGFWDQRQRYLVFRPPNATGLSAILNGTGLVLDSKKGCLLLYTRWDGIYPEQNNSSVMTPI